jgi:hypothetical protein
VLDTVSGIAAGDWIEFDVTAHVTGNGTYAFALQSDTDPGDIDFYSKESGSVPELIVAFGGAVSNNPPVFASNSILTMDGEVGVAYADTIAAYATDLDADILTFSRVCCAGGAWLTVAPDGVLSGTPTLSDVGTDAYTVNVTDGNGGSDVATVIITVNTASPMVGVPAQRWAAILIALLVIPLLTTMRLRKSFR